MKKAIILLYVGITCMMICAGEIPSKWVRVKGVGTNFEEALKQAHHEAVRAVIGFNIVSQKKTVNDHSDTKILTSTDGAILNHKVISVHTSGKYIILTIDAEVIKREHFLASRKKQTSTISRSDRIELIRSIEAKDDMVKTLQTMLWDFPNQFLNKSITTPRYNDNKKLTEDKKSIQYEIQYDIIIDVNNEQYVRLAKLLNSFFSKYAYRTGRYSDIQLNEGNHNFLGSACEVLLLASGKLAKDFYTLGTKNYEYYALPQNIYRTFSKLTSGEYTICAVDFQNAQGKTFKTDFVNMEQLPLTFIQAPLKIKDSIVKTLAPRIMLQERRCTPFVQFSVTSMLTLEEIKAWRYTNIRVMQRDQNVKYPIFITPEIKTPFVCDCVEDIKEPVVTQRQNIKKCNFCGGRGYYITTTGFGTDGCLSSVGVQSVRCVKCQGKGTIEAW